MGENLRTSGLVIASVLRLRSTRGGWRRWVGTRRGAEGGILPLGGGVQPPGGGGRVNVPVGMKLGGRGERSEPKNPASCCQSKESVNAALELKAIGELTGTPAMRAVEATQKKMKPILV